MAYPARLNRLDAVNIMLTMCGQAPVSTVEGAVPSIVAVAKNILDEETRRILSEGFSFNTYEDVVFYPDTSNGNKIGVPADILGVDHADPYRDIQMDGGFFYDANNATYAFTDPLTLTVVRSKDFASLAEPVKTYIAVLAGRTLQRRMFANLELDRALAQDEARALVTFKQWEADQLDPNIRNTDIGYIVRGSRRSIFGTP